MNSQDEGPTGLSGNSKRSGGWPMGSAVALGVGAAIGAAASQFEISRGIAIALGVIIGGAVLLVYMQFKKKP